MAKNNDKDKDRDMQETAYNTTQAGRNREGYSQDGTEAVLPVIEEELQVGKREVERGGVRVTTSMTETPVEEQVQLHEESVQIQRNKVDRPLTQVDMAAFQEGVIEVTATAEEAIVSKQARIVEEIVIDKQVQERVETVRDSVRRTDVQIEQIQPGGMSSSTDMSGYATFSSDFQRHYGANYANSGYTFQDYSPVYEYGYTLANDQNYRGKDWKAVEKDARQGWEQTNPGTWEQFKDTVKYAWDKGRSQS